MEPVVLNPVGPGNWRALAALEVAEEQRAFVAPVTRYLSMCAYGDGPWQPREVAVDGRTVGFVMHAVDDDQSYWIGGLLVDTAEQGKGYGRAAVRRLIDDARAGGHPSVALSYLPANTAARTLYRSLGFEETGEREDEEVVARLRLP